MRILTHTAVKQVRYGSRWFRKRFRIELDRATLIGDRLLVATGRTPNTAEPGLKRSGSTQTSAAPSS